MKPKIQLTPINENEWEISADQRQDMLTSVRIFASRSIIDHALKDSSLEQAMNATTLPGVRGSVIVMPDIHQGYGLPIGGVVATSITNGVISPGAIGYDINCGVRLLASEIPLNAIQSVLPELGRAINQQCPSGVGREGDIILGDTELDELCSQGLRWAEKKGYAQESDLIRTEDNGCVAGASTGQVSRRSRERSREQLGTLGSGNHFIEVGVVSQVFDKQAAALMGLQEGCLTIMIHSGSRGFGHQICTDFVQDFQKVVRNYGIGLVDRELVCAPLDSPEGQKYLAAMRAAANYAFVNRQVLTFLVRKAVLSVLQTKIRNPFFHQVYDISHNIGKIETHTINGHQEQVFVHRKGATRAFGPDYSAISDAYQSIGQPVLVPGSMGTSSWVLVGTSGSMKKSLGSSCHGAGRLLSRSRAKQEIRVDSIRRDLAVKGIVLHAGSNAGIVEEAPEAYKDVDDVIEVVCNAQITRKVARLRPVIVIKG